MRVVAGLYAGRRLRGPAGRATRPTAERVREALFAVLGEQVRGAAVLDGYAGSGSLGIEALSRGAARVVFVEKDPAAAAVIRANLAAIGLEGSALARVLVASLERSAKALGGCAPGGFDLWLVDPPFDAVRDGSAMRALERLAAGRVLRQGGLAVVEVPADHPPLRLEGLALEQLRPYGDSRLAFLRAPAVGGGADNFVGA
jgi:16S rRNA (guanine966-N2)-methyltransferase